MRNKYLIGIVAGSLLFSLDATSALPELESLESFVHRRSGASLPTESDLLEYANKGLSDIRALLGRCVLCCLNSGIEFDAGEFRKYDIDPDPSKPSLLDPWRIAWKEYTGNKPFNLDSTIYGAFARIFRKRTFTSEDIADLTDIRSLDPGKNKMFVMAIVMADVCKKESFDLSLFHLLMNRFSNKDFEELSSNITTKLR